MRREQLADLAAFITVARERSFTRAAARLGLSPSALSHTVRRLEDQLGMALLTRTTRSLSPTAAGQRLIDRAGPSLDLIAAEVDGVSALRDVPAGLVRITTGDHAAESILMPALARLLPCHPALEVEVSVDAGFVDIAAAGFDAGIRLGETVAQDMVAVPIGPDLAMAAVAAPAYFARHPAPRVPQDLAGHCCINLRFPTHGSVYVWEFEQAGRSLNVRVEGQLTVNDIALARRAALGGAGIAFMPDDYVRGELASGTLVRVLADWCPPFAGYHLYYPSRRLLSPGLAAIVGALRLARGA